MKRIDIEKALDQCYEWHPDGSVEELASPERCVCGQSLIAGQCIGLLGIPETTLQHLAAVTR